MNIHHNQPPQKTETMKTIASLVFLCMYTLAFANYEFVKLDSQAGTESGVYDINEYGYSSGYKFQNGKATPCLWSPSGDFYPLSSPLGVTLPQGIAYSINDWFEVAGTFGSTWSNGLNAYHLGSGAGVVWTFDFDIGDFLPFEITTSESAIVRSINNDGVIAGREYGYAFTWDVYEETGYDSDNWDSYCFAINDLGNATGMTSEGQGYSATFIEKMSDGSYTVLSGLSKGLSSFASGGIRINNKNQIVGLTANKGFYWEPKTGACTIFADETTCYGINDKGQIVGKNNGRATLWTKSANSSFVEIDLNQFVNDDNIVLERAFGINESGQIVGQYLNKDTGIRNAFMLTPSTEVQASLSKVTDNELKLGWPTVDGSSYRIKVSTDLQAWGDLPNLYVAEGAEGYVFIARDHPKMFFRVLSLTP